PQYGTPSTGWGAQYGGISSRSQCDAFPEKLKAGCYWRFDWFQNADNPSVSFQSVACPLAITNKSGCVRADDKPTGDGSVPTVSGGAPPATSTGPGTTTPSSGTGNGGTVAKYAQCGGNGWTGGTGIPRGSGRSLKTPTANNKPCPNIDFSCPTNTSLRESCIAPTTRCTSESFSQISLRFSVEALYINSSIFTTRHTVIDSQIDLPSSWVTVMCRATRFHITISHKDIQSTRFATQYSKMVSSAIDDDGAEAHDELCEWMIDPCLSYFRESTSNVQKEITFGDFYYPETHHLKLLVSGSELSPKATRVSGTMNAFYLMIPSSDLPPSPEIPRLKASHLRIISDPKWDDYMSEIPQKAIIADGSTKFFKPADDKKQILREVNMHMRIRRARLQDLRIAKLHGIVVSDDGEMTIGLLLDLIPIPSTGDSLYSYRNSALAREYHERWKQQITDTVEQLHSHGLVWGDVHPGNIVIDTSFDAWVVDFGGGSIVEFVPRKMAGMKEGDWCGVGKVFNEWILENNDN
ncbi:hypothetical protein O988_07166, partial [Pseudogymnoascus sp. VKM F-3808]